VRTETKYNIYRHSKTSEYVVRTLSYSLPTILFGHVDVIAPTTYFGTMRSMKVTSFMQSSIEPADSDINVMVDAVDTTNCSSTVTPSCLRALYGTASYKPRATDKNLFGITGYLENYANFADLQVCTLLHWRSWSITHCGYCIRRSSRCSVLTLLVEILPL
jgi:tripeptidyl-peptidase-1